MKVDAIQQYIFPVADMVIHCGQYGLFVRPMWFVADMVVADMVCGRYGTDPLSCTHMVNREDKLLFSMHAQLHMANNIHWHTFRVSPSRTLSPSGSPPFYFLHRKYYGKIKTGSHSMGRYSEVHKFDGSRI